MIKLVTIMFADVVGSTAQAEQMHPEDTRALIANLFEAMSEEIHAEGGTIERIIGDAIMADFGVPITREDDAQRAVKAALRMLARLERFNSDRGPAAPIQLRIGINTGEVSTGGSYGEQLMVMGDAVNVAARLQQMAEPDQVLVGERTARVIRDKFDLKEVAPLSVKGKTSPISAFLVVDEREAPAPRVMSFTAPMVGRDSELQALKTVWERVVADRVPSVAIVIGEPGVGKSRLVQEFLSSIELESKYLYGRYPPYGAGATLAPLREILRSEAGLLVSDSEKDALAKIQKLWATVTSSGPAIEGSAEGLAATIGLLPRADLDPREAHRELLRSWRGLLSGLAELQPLVVVIEDVHWAESSLLDAISDFVQHVEGPVMFLCSSRPELLQTNPGWVGSLKRHSSIYLEPLDENAAASLAGLLLGSPEISLAGALAKAGGNPFFLEEIIRRLVEDGHLTDRAGRFEIAAPVQDVEIPDSVQAAILSRLDRLDADERMVLQHAAVVGRTFWAGAIRQLLPVVDVDRSLGLLRQREFVVERPSSPIEGDVEYAFRHVLIRDVAYDSLPRASRGAAHATIAEWIQKIRGERVHEISELLAHHYDRAQDCLRDPSLREKARRWCMTAARETLHRFAIDQAEVLSRRGVELSEPGTGRIEALEALGEVLDLSGRGDAAWQIFTTVLDEFISTDPHDKGSLARIAAKAAIIPTRYSAHIEAAIPSEDIDRVIKLGLAAAGETYGRERVFLLVSKAFLQAAGYEQLDEAGIEAARAAVAIAENLGDSDALSAALDAEEAVAMSDGRYGQLEQLVQRRLELVPRLSSLDEVLDIFGVAAYANAYIGRYRDAIRFASTCMQRAEGIDLRNYLHALVWRVQSRFMAGDWDETLEDYAAIEQIQARGDLPAGTTIRALGAAFFCRSLRGEEEHADEYLRLLRTYYETNKSAGLLGVGPLALAARALAHRGEAEEARGWLRLERSVYLGGQLESMCEVIAACKDWGDAKDVVSMARTEAERGELLALARFADRLDGRIAVAESRLADAQSLLQNSARGFAALGASWEAAWSNQLLGEVLVEVGDRDAARKALDDALVTFERLRSVREAERSRELLLST